MVLLAAAAAQFGRDLDFDLDRVASIVAAARRAGAGLLVLPDGTLGGYLNDLREPDSTPESDPSGTVTPDPAPGGSGGAAPDAVGAGPTDIAGGRPVGVGGGGPAELPPALAADDPVFDRLVALAGDLVLCLGYRERAGALTYNAAVCLSGAGIHGRHRKVHLAPGERVSYASGDRFAAFDTPVGRLGMLIDYDKTFPEAARALAEDGAVVLACLSAWPASLTDPARRVVKDRQARLFDLYDCARAAENQVVLVSANQTGRGGALTFLGNAKVVGPGGDIRARTWQKAGLAMAEVDLAAEVSRARRVLHHLAERRPAAYRAGCPAEPAGELPAAGGPESSAVPAGDQLPVDEPLRVE
ncbi:MAG TPA: carbon-nitrogen hydrolase family protein [Pseudonocardia sp.]|nr:carbon-nitrogen hydrolase family protein [Pseudonocardia sp.]